MVRILNESGHERNRNAGDEAYFAAMVDVFRQTFDNIEIKAFSDRPEHDIERYDVKTVYSGGTIKRSIRSIVDVYKAIKWCDVYVWGGGQILRDDTFILATPYRLSRPLLASLMGKPVMAFGVGIGPLEKPPFRLLAKWVFGRFTLITYRDSKTEGILRGLGLKEPLIQKTVDTAFALIPSDEKSIDALLMELGLEDNSQPLIGAAPYGPAFRGKFSGIRNFLPAKIQADRDLWQKGGKESYGKHVQMLADFYDEIIEKYQARLVFIVQDASSQGLDDKICHDILNHMKNQQQTVILNGDDYPPALLKGLMGRMKVVTGGRMHSLILASGVNTPVMAICYELKIKELAEAIDQHACFIDGYDTKDKSDLVRVFDMIWNSSESIANTLKERNRELLKEVDQNMMRLKKLVERQ